MISKEEYQENINTLAAYLDAITDNNFEHIDSNDMSELLQNAISLYNNFAYVALIAPTMAYKLNTFIQKLEKKIFESEA